jgi:dTDP-4-dehydrorhamnose reductase
MLGTALVAEAKRLGFNPIGAARKGANLLVDLSTGESQAVLRGLPKRPDLLINAAAQTDLGKCESEPDLTSRLNSQLPGRCGELADEWKIPFIQISTDHFFVGTGPTRHDEGSPITLCNSYARSKFLGEEAALRSDRTLVLRTNLVGFRPPGFPASLVQWALGSLSKKETIRGFSDYFVSSIDVRTFARCLFQLTANSSLPTGILNLASSEVFSKFDFLVELARVFGHDPTLVQPSTVQSLPGPQRATSLGLDVLKAERLLGFRLPDLRAVVAALKEESGFPEISKPL